MAPFDRLDVVGIGEDPERLVPNGIVHHVGHLGRVPGVLGHPLLDHLSPRQILFGRRFR